MSTVKSSIFHKAILGGFATHLIANLANIAFVPLALSYFGETNYGFWAITLSVLTYLAILQMGIGPAIGSLIAKSTNVNERRALILSSCKFLSLIASIGLLLVAIASFIILAHQDHMLFFSLNTSRTLTYMILISVFLFFLRLPGSFLSSVFIGLQCIHIERVYAGILPATGALAALALTVFLTGGIVEFSLIIGVIQVLIVIATSLHLLYRFSDLRFSWKDWLDSKIYSPLLFVSSGRFFMISLSASVVWGADNLVIGYFLGPDLVTPYSITFKLFIASYAIFIILNSSLWPMFGKAVGNSDWGWIVRIYQQITALVPVISGLIWIGGILFAKPIIYVWTGPSGYAGAMVVFALGGYGYVLSLINANATFLGGINETYHMMWIGFYEAFANLVLSICLIFIFGIGGVALGTFLAAALTAFWMLPRVIARVTNDKVTMCWNPVLKNISILIPSLTIALLLSYLYDGMYLFISGSCIILIYLFACWYWMDLQFIAQYRKRFFNF